MDYGFFKAFEQVREDAAAIKAGVRRLEARTVEMDALRKEIADLLKGDAEMAAKVDAAFTKSQAAEDKLRSAIPQ